MDYPDGVVMVAILKGGVLFLADLVRIMTVPTRRARGEPGSSRTWRPASPGATSWLLRTSWTPG